MSTIENVTGATTQHNVGQQRTLYRAMRRAAMAQRQLNEAIYRVTAYEENNTVICSSSESDCAVAGNEGRRPEGAAFRYQRTCGSSWRIRSYPYYHGRCVGGYERNGGHYKRHPMTRFPPGRHTKGFDSFTGMMRRRHHMGHRISRPHPHPHPSDRDHHHQKVPPFDGANWLGRHKRHGFTAGCFARNVHRFGIGHGSGHGERAGKSYNGIN